jgi:uncharacterized protein (DUF433 family)
MEAESGYNEAMVALLNTQLEIDAEGIAWLSGTRVKVIEVVLDKLAHGWSPEEIHFQHPGLSLAHIHAALAYYYENQARLDAQIRGQLDRATALSEEVSDPAFRQKLKELRRPV